ncbi:ABC transporter ATP-binding protein [Synechococcus sp. CCY9201]|uniref:ABC transporter ATP-binding protein n=1 Tax=unclassified Synechococcus TaxID=2626047 RepID=UPI0018CE1C5F|nr:MULTISPECIES: ABC transporter ATP-binding protein [unclassified Synechococcus]MEA5424843.1 ABC transporter ATP-binding protein [Synechococcus sp. CCY9202]MEA5475062.1 ABC transporter ATP-binding protein [Synechococcus sp. CCY9201]QPN60507.1 ABC transporter ATP-binding protein [Synechococcus sp. CBW1002]QPN67784.1 ABC transporter ATP-binding protein [Synechococcus sp. CBW1006]
MVDEPSAPAAPGPSAQPVLRIANLVVRYPLSDRPTLDGLDLSLAPGDRLALVGPSGCGKSTVARAVQQLLPQGSLCSGQLEVAGVDPRQLKRPALRRLRGEAIGLVFQDPMTRLNPLLTIGEHLSDTLEAHRAHWLTGAPMGASRRRRAVRQRAEALLTRVGIGVERYGSYPHEFSGGMRQRLAIALALALAPKLVVADEPTTSLDVAVASQVMAELTSLCQEAGSALLLISHDLAMAGRWCDRIAVLDQGRLVEEAPSHQLLTAPASPLTRRLVSKARAREGLRSSAPVDAPLLLELEELRSWHPLPSLPWQQRWLKAVDGVSLRLLEGETIGVVGASGCGKSSLCRALMGLAPVRGGAVRLQGRDLRQLGGRELRRARRRIQMVFQDPLACLNPQMPVGEAIADPLLIHRLASRSAARQRARELMEAVGLTPAEDFEHRRPRQLSGGQQQRVAIARALILEPKVLLCDESVSMLDAEVQADVLALLRRLQAELGLGLLFVTHDLSVASGFCHRVIVLDGGRIVEEGPGAQLLRHPQAAITRILVDACPRLPALAA